MNENAKKLGMNQTYFLNESGLDENNKVSGAYGSAKDMGILFEYMLMFHSNILEATTFDDTAVPTVDKAKRTAINTNTLVGQTPRVLASKTGLTDLAGGNLVMAIDAGLAHPVIIAVLGSTQEGRFSDMKALIAQTEQTLNLEP
jgi:D-alanyl-D-alanine carboxypeptidase (penicillin-binding protein 5/6)